MPRDVSEKTVAETVDSRRLAWKRATRNDWVSFVRGCVNTTGATFFILGSITSVLELNLYVSMLFIIGNCCYITTGIWWAIDARRDFHRRYEERGVGVRREPFIAGPGSVPPPYAPLPADAAETEQIIQAFRSLTWLDIAGAMNQTLGAFLFNVGCVTMWLGDDWVYATTTFWTVGSGFFLLQGAVGHILATSFIEPLITLVPRNPSKWRHTNPPCCRRKLCLHHCIPAALFNTIGSTLFVAGSLVLCWPITTISCGWLFLVGSMFFLVSNYSDIASVVDGLYSRAASEK
ncbi:YrhK-like protein [Gregarina niphandrodes]|uniref:YrhK-like protein n=1 Tax=Gregarina niphandrodes TaxID=110365 RepID=A0A023BAD1_GRENI|nr:YrhK-like protein [Gregarina niphandrodes]EZG78202.1 YrhK-like protein [Gregarina niphandrodes]|eukprot:XP_011129422.1 YrhK-like protein [Gregarina niphandrodes]